MEEKIYDISTLYLHAEELAQKGERVTPQELRLIKDEAAWEQTKLNAFEDGRLQEEEQIAISMLQKGMELALIAEITGLKLEVIETLTLAKAMTE